MTPKISIEIIRQFSLKAPITGKLLRTVAVPKEEEDPPPPPIPLLIPPLQNDLDADWCRQIHLLLMIEPLSVCLGSEARLSVN